MKTIVLHLVDADGIRWIVAGQIADAATKLGSDSREHLLIDNMPQPVTVAKFIIIDPLE